MATRGTAIYISEDFVSAGPEFNGDMYPHGYGDEFFEALSKVTDNVEFIKFNNRFNKYNFGYDKIMSSYQGKVDVDTIIENSIYSMNRITGNGELWITSDWVFVKNGTDKRIRLSDNDGNVLYVQSGETVRFYFGRFRHDGNNHRIKASK